MARSIQAYGFNNPIVTDNDLNVAAGHTRLKAARKLGLETVPVIRVPGLVGSKFAGFSIADNKTAEIADWDKDLLAQLVSELNLEVDFDLGSLGFNDKELTDLLDQNIDDPEDVDSAPPCPGAPVTRPGDLYILGDHRLLCGDATKSEDLQRLVGSEKIDCVLTDPPYGVGYMSCGQNREQWGEIKSDNLDPEKLEEFLRATLLAAAAVCRPGATAYICHGISKAGIRIAFERAFVAAGFRLSSTIVWVKQVASMGWGPAGFGSIPQARIGSHSQSLPKFPIPSGREIRARAGFRFSGPRHSIPRARPIILRLGWINSITASYRHDLPPSASKDEGIPISPPKRESWAVIANLRAGRGLQNGLLVGCIGGPSLVAWAAQLAAN